MNAHHGARALEMLHESHSGGKHLALSLPIPHAIRRRGFLHELLLE